MTTVAGVTYLDRIVEHHRAAAAADRRRLDDLVAAARRTGAPRPFRDALVTGDGGVAVIAEVKRRSPSKGDLAAGLDPAALARSYAAGGAAALSVLTDGEFFGGSAADLGAARAATALPVLRKDFTVDARDVADARLMGADAVLLIVAALDPAELADLHTLAGDLGLAALVEVHDEAELDVALGIGATVVGVNQRDLVTFEVDHERAIRVGREIPEGVVKVAESGIRGAADAAQLADAGFDALLVGETLVTAPDPVAALRSLRAVRP